MNNFYTGKKTIKWALVIIIGVITLSAGLQQRGSFSDNWIAFNENSKITEIGSYGLAYGDFPVVTHSDHSLILDFVIVPVEFTKSDFKVFTQIGPIGSDDPLIIGQWRTQLIILQGKDYANKLRKNRLQAELINHIGQELRVHVVLGSKKNELFLNGHLVHSHAVSERLNVKKNSKISIGNSHDGKQGWSGEVKSFEISVASDENASRKVVRHYSFTEWSGTHIADQSESNLPLTVPKPGRFLEKSQLRMEGIDALIEWNVLDIVVNLLGFIPMGIAMAWLTRQPSRFRTAPLVSTITAITLCAFASLLIELSQQYIPGRQSHLHDLILNICGGLLGVILFNLVTRRLFSPSELPDQPPK